MTQFERLVLWALSILVRMSGAKDDEIARWEHARREAED